MKKIDVLTIGGAVKDFTFYTNQGKLISTPNDLTSQKVISFEYGAKILATETHQSFGGGAFNAATSLARLGLRVGIATRLGRDAIAEEVIGQIKRNRIDSLLVQSDKEQCSGFSLIITTDKKDHEHVAFLERGANNFFSLDSKKLNQFRAQWYYVTSLSGKYWQSNLKHIFSQSVAQKTKIFWNPGSTQIKAGVKILQPFLKQTQVLMLNKDEAIELVLSGVKLGRKNPNFLNRPVYLLNVLHDWGPKIVIITEGKKGAWVFDGKKIYQHKSAAGNIINTTGVGDAFGSSFLAGFICTNDIANSLKWGIYNSASVLSKIGAQTGLLSRSELLKKVNK